MELLDGGGELLDATGLGDLQMEGAQVPVSDSLPGVPGSSAERQAAVISLLRGIIG